MAFLIEMFRSVRMRMLAVMMMACMAFSAVAQINTDQMIRVGRNALYFEDYVLSIQYFNSAIGAKPYLAQPYFYRALAKFYLEDYQGAEADASAAIERNPFIGDAYELRGIVRQNRGNVREAVDDYDEALKLSPHNRGLLFNKALALDELGDHDKAAEAFATLLERHPGYADGYLGRAKMLMAAKDTIAALSDINKALEIDPNNVNGFVMRADIAINSESDYRSALDDMDHAIRLQPKYAGFYINRAFLRHELDDYHGAMEDYDYALQLDPSNTMAMFNRAMLRAEVHDFNRAIDDLNQVEELNGSSFRTLYNRAIIYRQLGNYEAALADIDRVVEAYPDLAAAYFLRYDILHAMGRRQRAQNDYERSLALAKKRVQVVPGTDGEIDVIAAAEGADGEDQEAVARRFTRLITIADNAEMDQEFNNKSIRGRVQDRNAVVELEPLYVVTYYSSPTELRPSSDFIREVNDLNASRVLRFVLQVTNNEPSIGDADEINRHFSSIDYTTSYLATYQARPVDYFSRGMDYLSVHNYPEALADFGRAVDMQPDFTLAWLMKGIARYKELHAAEADTEPMVSVGHLSQSSGSPSSGMIPSVNRAAAGYRLIIDDFERVATLSPDMAVIYYDMGVVYAENGDLASAQKQFDKAIALRPDFGEAYYNRGYVNLKLGHRAAGIADLSRSGELGVVRAYNLLKRMSR